jgi:uncharacterized protein (DUF1697 family)
MVRTSDICQGLAYAGFKNVKGFRQSGNIIFDAEDADTGRIVSAVQMVIHGLIGKDVGVFLRTMKEVREMVRLDPFGKLDADVKMFVTFYHGVPEAGFELPLKSSDGDAAIILVRGREAYGLGYLRDGRYGASYGKIEVKLGTPSTTRNWNTVKGIAALPGQ